MIRLTSNKYSTRRSAAFFVRAWPGWRGPITARPILWLAVILLLAGCNRTPTAQQLATEVEDKLARVSTVQGLLDISFQGVTLEQKLWVERPARLRTETAAGPSAFRGVIVVLNDQEGWVYSPALAMATVVDRSNYNPELAGAAGAGSLLERIPAASVSALQAGYPLNVIGRQDIAGRNARHIELIIGNNDPTFPAGPLQLWLDDQYGYPLAFVDSAGRNVRFRSVLFNQDIDPLTFVFFPPPTAEVRRVETSTP